MPRLRQRRTASATVFAANAFAANAAVTAAAATDAGADTDTSTETKAGADPHAKAEAKSSAKVKATSARQHVNLRLVALLRYPVNVSSFGTEPKDDQMARFNFMGPAKASQGQPRPAKFSQGRPGIARARASQGKPEQNLSRPFAVLLAS